MKKLAFFAVVIAMFAMMSGVALADGPHGPFSDDTALCAACHRAHTASGPYLIMDVSTIGLCTGCHDGSGADTDVVLGNLVENGSWISYFVTDQRYAATTVSANSGPALTVSVVDATGYEIGETVAIAAANGNVAAFTAGTRTITNVNLTTDVITVNTNITVTIGMIVGNVTKSASDHETWGTAGEELMGGGFDGVLGAGNPTTSAHIADISDGDLKWGVQFGEGTTGPLTTMTCVSCHLPHRSASYRMLRATPEGMNSDDGDLLVADNMTRDPVTGAVTGDHNFTEDTGMYNVKRAGDLDWALETSDGVSAWCGACHDYYYENAQRGDAHDGDAAPVAGAGMTTSAYYDLDGDATLDTTYMHSIDVDLLYTPRNMPESAELELYLNLGTNATYGDRMPVAAAAAQVDYAVTDEVTCLSCHRAHGTEAAVTGNAAIGVITRLNITAPQRTPTTLDDYADSVLLRLPQRAVCETCHDMPAGY